MILLWFIIVLSLICFLKTNIPKNSTKLSVNKYWQLTFPYTLKT